MIFPKITAKQSQIIRILTFSNILEWYDIYSYAYFAPILAQVFFDFKSPIYNLIGAFGVFGSGLIARPFGGILFGRIGDLLGRKQAFICSIIFVTMPTFIMGCLPTYAEVGLLAPLLLVFLRILQSIPAAGEVPGTVCFLYENSTPENRKFLMSWTAVGNQIGSILGLITSFLMIQFMSNAFLLSWGWRVAFWVGGMIGLFSIYLRKKLAETPVYIKLKEQYKTDKESVLKAISNHKNKIIMCTSFGVLNAATFYLIAIYLPSYLNGIIGLKTSQTVFTSLLILVLTTITLPLFGMLAEKVNNKKTIIACALMIILLLYPLYISINNRGNIFTISVIACFYVLATSCLTVFLSYRFAHIFPSSVRYTGVGLSFNLSDGIVGGLTPAISLLLLHYTKNEASFCWFILVCAVISLISYFKIKE